MNNAPNTTFATKYGNNRDKVSRALKTRGPNGPVAHQSLGFMK